MLTKESFSDFKLNSSPLFPSLSESSYNEIIGLNSKNETCGVIRNGEFIQLKNYSRQQETALIDTADIKPDDILFHTHTNNKSSPLFSKRDILTGKRNKLRLLLYHTAFHQFDYWSPDIYHPYPLRLRSTTLNLQDYLNLPYQWVRSDCYSFCKDVAGGIYNKHLPEIYNRQQSLATLKYFFMNPEQLGFRKIRTFREGCFVLLALSASIPHHMGIITHVYDDKTVMMLHQLGQEIDSSLINLRDLMGNIVGIYDIDKTNQNYFPPCH